MCLKMKYVDLCTLDLQVRNVNNIQNVRDSKKKEKQGKDSDRNNNGQRNR